MVKKLLERTFVAAKPDALQRGLVGEIIKRFEQKGLKLIGLKMIWPTEKQAREHYRLTPDFIKKLATNTRQAAAKKGISLKETDREIAERVREWNVKYLTEGPLVVMAWEGFHALEIGRKIIGPAEAKQAPIGTIRGDFTVDSYEMADNLGRPLRNLVHASGNKEEAEHELKLWFKPEELFSWKKDLWKILHHF